MPSGDNPSSTRHPTCLLCLWAAFLLAAPCSSRPQFSTVPTPTDHQFQGLHWSSPSPGKLLQNGYQVAYSYRSNVFIETSAVLSSDFPGKAPLLSCLQLLPQSSVAQPKPPDSGGAPLYPRPGGSLVTQNLQQLTDEVIETLGLVLPVNTQEIDGHSCQHDGQADAAHHRLRPQAEHQQEGPEQQVDDGKQQVDLWSRGTISCVDPVSPGSGHPSLFFTLRESL